MEEDLEMFRRLATEPDLIGLDWAGLRDAGAPARRFAADGNLGADDSRLMVEVKQEHTAAGFVSWRPSGYSVAKYWEIGIALLPEWRGRGIGWRAQAMLCDYLFHHTPAERIEARTHVENIAEHKALEKAGFQREGLLRSAEFRAGQWSDGWIYSRFRGETLAALSLSQPHRAALVPEGGLIRRGTTTSAHQARATRGSCISAACRVLSLRHCCRWDSRFLP
jgi:RimJ/RimL family protein N-acetyltransferase